MREAFKNRRSTFIKNLVATSNVIFTCTKPGTGDEKVSSRVLLLLLLDTLCFNLKPHGTTIIYELDHKVLTNVEYRAVSGVFQNIDPTTPLSTQRVCPPPHQWRGGTHSPGGEREGGPFFGRRQTLNY
jgi:hypothetical protein